DAVLYLEGERFHAFRILRATKNRFGSTDEVGVFEMAENGLREVANPSEVFLEERSRGVAGSVIVPTVEGTRPLLVEVQALVTPTSFGLPRRTVNGADPQRVLLLLAVLAKRAGLSAGSHDVYVSLVGGLRLREPAADLGRGSGERAELVAESGGKHAFLPSDPHRGEWDHVDERDDKESQAFHRQRRADVERNDPQVHRMSRESVRTPRDEAVTLEEVHA